jgi:hypothetical protein
MTINASSNAAMISADPRPMTIPPIRKIGPARLQQLPRLPVSVNKAKAVRTNAEARIMATKEWPRTIGPLGTNATPTGTVTAKAEKKATSFTLSIECIHPKLLNDFYKNIIFGHVMGITQGGLVRKNYYIDYGPL